MYEFGNPWAEGRSTQMASYHSMMHEIHVLLVDHDFEGLVDTAKMLEICQYRVTYVELASVAISMLASGKTKFDIVMANINSPDLHGFKLLQYAVNIDIPVVLMSVDENTFMAMRALENGAFLYIKKPASMEMLKCLWQHVIREKMLATRERERLAMANYSPARGIEFKEVIPHEGETYPNNNVEGMTMMITSKGKAEENNKGKRLLTGDEERGSENQMLQINSNVKRKMCTEWTQELHAKFMDAVEQLGEGRCFPKEILEMMNVPGLTRMQVASHLQKCRNDNWRSPEVRKYHHQGSQAASSDTHSRLRRFGSKPQLSKAVLYRVTGLVPETNQVPNNGGHGNLGQPVIINHTSQNHHQQHYGSVVPDPSNVRHGSSNHRHASDDFFNFQGMDNLMMQNNPGGGTVNNPNQVTPGAYHYNRVYPEQSAVDSRSQWSSDTTNFGSDESETKGHE